MSGRRILLDDVRAGDVRGHQVGRELDAAELQPERRGDGAHHQRLRRAGQAGDQAMPADEQRDQDLLQDLVLPDDDLANLLEDAIPHAVEALHALLQVVGVQLGDGYGAHA